MRLGGTLLVVFVVGLAARPVQAQILTAAPAQSSANLSPLQIGVACAPLPFTVAEDREAIRVLGAQDAEPRALLGVNDTVVLSGGTAHGLAVGQEYFVRRLLVDPNVHGRDFWPVQTSGWIRITAVNDRTALGAVLNACGPIEAGDFIQPFARPDLPATVDRVDTSGQLDFTTTGRVLFGGNLQTTSAVGDYLVIDQGVDRGVEPGAFIALYRDPDVTGLPLVAIGEGTVVSVGPEMSLVRVNAAQTEVRAGDYVVPRR